MKKRYRSQCSSLVDLLQASQTGFHLGNSTADFFFSFILFHLFYLFICAQDVQVPVCPLCNTPIPIKRGEMPDIKVGEHIDRDCKSDPAQRKRKVKIINNKMAMSWWLELINELCFLFCQRYLQISAPKEAASRRR